MSSVAGSARRDLFRLALLYGVQTVYVDVSGRRRRVSPESLVAVLRALEAPLHEVREAPAALRERQAALWRRGCAPVSVLWEGRAGSLDLSLPADQEGALDCRLQLEDGKTVYWSVDPARLPRSTSAVVSGRAYVRARLALPAHVPRGYHRLTVRAGRRRFETLVIAAPRRAYAPPDGGAAARTWGIFLPLYALHSQRSCGCGDLADLDHLLAWVGGMGGGVVATLPLLAAFLDEPFEPSPYVPVSRLFWNELYLDPAAAGLAECPEARALSESAALRAELATMAAAPLVDFRRVMRAKRGVLEALAACFFRRPSVRQEEFFRFVAARPALEDYARFRAAGERRRAPWRQWPAALRDGAVGEGDYDEAARRYHLYVQWLAHEQLEALATGARRRGPGLYLDLPLGVHPDGYDVWRERAVFARGVSGGAPPDAFFTKGQDWGFPPLHPERLRAQQYRYFVAAIRHHLRYAGILRIDHVMGLHRLFWVPHGMEARQGVYVRHHAEELYAILTLESHRHRAMIAGEDLGTVPPEVHRAMPRHNLYQMYVVQYEAKPRARALRRPASSHLAGLNTHDMPSFAAFWAGQDVRDRRSLGLLDAAGARWEKRGRQNLRRALVAFLTAGRWLRSGRSGAAAVLRALLDFLASSPARIVIVPLEDLWGERRPQNTPGTGAERPNWRRRARYDLETFSRMRAVTSTLRLVNRRRGQERSARGQRR